VACDFDVASSPSKLSFWCFEVAMQYFEEILMEDKNKGERAHIAY